MKMERKTCGVSMMILSVLAVGCVGAGPPVDDAPDLGRGPSCGPGNIEPGEPDTTAYNKCAVRAGSCPHRGGDLIHDICADGLPPNVAWDHILLSNADIPRAWYANPDKGGRAGAGCDVELAGREFDALSWDSRNENPIVWEVKTDEWWTIRDAGLKTCRMGRFIKLFIKDCGIVVGCNQGVSAPEQRLRYKMVFSDQPLANAMSDHFAKRPELLPPEARQYCFIEDAQPCRVIEVPDAGAR